ncbi:MAG: hypothetical protein HY556_05160 [Euryarchaeota archaeon]|nr:hypothetical protein [Euryarchaeota archaeon]
MFGELCVRCKGTRGLCGIHPCPLLEKVRAQMPARPFIGKELRGPSPPAVFVGHEGYPKLSIGPLISAPLEGVTVGLDDPTTWSGLSMDSVIAMRSSLLRSKRAYRVTDARDPKGMLETSQLLAMSIRPVETEVVTRKHYHLEPQASVDPFAAPMGPSVQAESAVLIDKPVIPRRVDALTSDVHASARTAIGELYRSGVTSYQNQRLLSIGLLGEERRRKLVPTRWSITAVDDMLGLELIEKAKGSQEIGRVEYRTATLYGNHFHVLLIPRSWSYALLEAWHQGSLWASENIVTEDHEAYDGRTGYAENTAGAYYAARLSVLEHLVARQRQATVLIYREITEEYWAPLGVWVIREGVRNAMTTNPLFFDSAAAAMAHVSTTARFKDWHRRSPFVTNLLRQKRLDDFNA